MKARFGTGVLLFLALPLLLLLAACTEPEVLDSEPLPTAPAASATPLPASVQAEYDAFIAQRQAIDAEWDEIHDAFDEWSGGLAACEPNAMRESLNEYAIAFIDVTEQARNLSRTQSTGELADLLITAAEDEEAALRELRDRWQPGNVSLFENVEQARARASRSQKDAEDRAIEILEELDDAGASGNAVGDFAESFDGIKGDLENIHSDYAALRDGAESMAVGEVYDGLERLAGELASVADAVEALPALAGTEDAVGALVDAVQAEVSAFSGVVMAPSDAPALPDFSGMDASVAQSESALTGMDDALGAISDAEPSEVNPAEVIAAVGVFNDEYASLRREWNDFHRGYNAWRKAEGGCDRAEVTQALNGYSLRMGRLGRDVADLPRAGYLLPMYTLLVEAAEREANAFRTLRNTWQPFTSDAFKALDRERANSGELRREADAALQELRNRF